ncbi:MAG TPA: 3-isopropylmalate dehydratase [bacterium]|nr:3-isopropylmalate dehydratase [bacterium]
MIKKISAEIFVLKDGFENLINDIDTDQIFHNKYLSIVDIKLMGQYALDNLDGYKDFAKKVKSGMVLVAGENFGSGSSRQQAVDCFISLGMQGVAAKSVGSIYKRNIINTGFPMIEITDIDEKLLETGTKLEFDIETSEIFNNGKIAGHFKKFSTVQKDIIEKNGLLNCL